MIQLPFRKKIGAELAWSPMALKQKEHLWDTTGIQLDWSVIDTALEALTIVAASTVLTLERALK